jgi:hypothetical protein
MRRTRSSLTPRCSRPFLPWSSSPSETDSSESSRRIQCTLLSVAALLSRVLGAHRSVFVCVLVDRYNYPFFLNIMGVFIYVPICFLYIWPMQIFGKSITKEQM